MLCRPLAAWWPCEQATKISAVRKHCMAKLQVIKNVPKAFEARPWPATPMLRTVAKAECWKPVETQMLCVCQGAQSIPPDRPELIHGILQCRADHTYEGACFQGLAVSRVQPWLCMCVAGDKQTHFDILIMSEGPAVCVQFTHL
jgi:hypothetical protein